MITPQAQDRPDDEQMPGWKGTEVDQTAGHPAGHSLPMQSKGKGAKPISPAGLTIQ